MGNILSIIIVTYNNSSTITGCLDSIVGQTYPHSRLSIVDNNSPDDTVPKIRSYLSRHSPLQKRTRIISSHTNEGFAKGVNKGLRQALRNEDVFACLLLNPDVYFGSNLFKEGVKILTEHPDIGAACPVILYPDNTIWWIGTRIFTDRELMTKPAFSISEHTKKREKWNNESPTQYVTDALTGCAMFIRRTAVERVGYLNEKYFMYAEDIDYSLRLNRAGFRLAAFTTATVYHTVSDTTMNSKSVVNNLSKYNVYLTSIAKFILTNKPFPIFLFWLLKLPYVFVYQYYKRSRQ